MWSTELWRRRLYDSPGTCLSILLAIYFCLNAVGVPVPVRNTYSTLDSSFIENEARANLREPNLKPIHHADSRNVLLGKLCVLMVRALVFIGFESNFSAVTRWGRPWGCLCSLFGLRKFINSSFILDQWGSCIQCTMTSVVGNRKVFRNRSVKTPLTFINARLVIQPLISWSIVHLYHTFSDSVFNMVLNI